MLLSYVMIGRFDDIHQYVRVKKTVDHAMICKRGGFVIQTSQRVEGPRGRSLEYCV